MLELVFREYARKAMSVSNMYIALLDSRNMITFPLFYQTDYETSELTFINVAPRYFDKNSNQKGRTEVILETKQPILIHTHKESITWYNQPGHEEKIGNPFASWVGVPILSNGESVGVIGVYHPTIEHLYTEFDILFLENVATHLSDLLIRFELRNAQSTIVQNESLLTTTLIAQDITRLVGNAFGSLSINIAQSKEDVKRAIQTNDVSQLKYTRDILCDADSVLDLIRSDISQIVSTEAQEVSIRDVTSKLVEQVKFEKQLKNVSFYNDYPVQDIKIKASYRSVTNCLYAVLDNAGAALSEQAQHPTFRDLYLQIHIWNNNGLVLIDITDNGTPILPDIKAHLFEIGVTSKSNGSGYGLWRAHAIVASMGGMLELLQTKEPLKTFRITLPIFGIMPPTPLAFVIDDERSWRNILTKWLVEEGFQVKTAEDVDGAQILFSEAKSPPQVVLLDLAPDKKQEGNATELNLIAAAKKLGGDVRVIVLAGYAKKEIGDADLLLEKVSDNGALTRSYFLEKIRKVLLK
ncbi:MAG: GAF domain-containing protein [Gallionella sp.]